MDEDLKLFHKVTSDFRNNFFTSKDIKRNPKFVDTQKHQ